jgi:hypothetical protein
MLRKFLSLAPIDVDELCRLCGLEARLFPSIWRAGSTAVEPAWLH